jgi:hypothetical protein
LVFSLVVLAGLLWGAWWAIGVFMGWGVRPARIGLTIMLVAVPLLWLCVVIPAGWQTYKRRRAGGTR